MSFEFFFGLFGLIASDSKSRHRSQLGADWRLFAPPGASLLRADQKGSRGSPDSRLLDYQREQAIFSTSGTLSSSAANKSVFASPSASSASSVASSSGGSSSSMGAALIKQPRGYHFAAEQLKGAESPTSQAGGGGSAGGRSATTANLDSLEDEEEPAGATGAASGAASRAPTSRARLLYCRLVCLSLWLQVLRLLVSFALEKSLLTLDFYHLGASRIHFLIPALCLALQAAAFSLIFIRNNQETNWLVPFYSSKDYLIRSRSNFRPRIEDYSLRVRVSILLALLLALLSSLSLSAYLFHCCTQSESWQQPADGSWSLERLTLLSLLTFDCLWAVCSTYICFIVSFYFNLICSIMKSRFHSICKIIEDLAESDTGKTTNQARKITTLYLEHNEACELLDESNDFWQYLIFFTYFTYIPAYCYCLYNLFFIDFEAWASFITWVIHTHTGLIILLVSFSAAGVSTEAHAPYTSLHTLSLIQLPLDVEVNITTFLHRVRGLTIGYSCYDLFAITNASMSNTAAACASYFLIVADFSRSSVFNLAQLNGSAPASAAAPAS